MGKSMMSAKFFAKRYSAPNGDDFDAAVGLSHDECRKYLCFCGSFMSQSYPVMFMATDPEDEDFGLGFHSCMQYVMAAKTRVFGDEETLAKIMKCKTPAEAEELGNAVQHYKERVWTKVCCQRVVQANRYKFAQNQQLRAKLLSTGSRVLLEAAPGDSRWGIGYPAHEAFYVNPKEWGTNWLGKALMVVRAELAAEYH